MGAHDAPEYALHPEASAASGQGWIEAGAHGGSREKLLHRNICPDEDKQALISHNFADMNAVPEKFHEQFDFCWSSCALEHLGSIEQGLQFIENSMRVLKPGGISVHTTEFNLGNGETIDNWPTVLFQKRHMEVLEQRLTQAGYAVSPFNFDAGDQVLDGLFDIPPWPWDVEKLNWNMLYCYTHLKKSIDGMPCTSIGITVRKSE
ncbi:class I SAM-dependent methyltransferase [Acidithiobacillus ferrivorans]|nr:class I SAM-dependent methyltransferase [Acidithiobacillus ferrivorans]